MVTMMTNELVRLLRNADPDGQREVYITAWFGNNEPLTDIPDHVYVDDEDDIMISGMVQHLGGGRSYRPTDATRLTPFHIVMLILMTLLTLVMVLNVMSP